MIGTQQAIIDMFMQSLLWCMNLQDNNVSILLRIHLHKGGNSYGVQEKGWQQKKILVSILKKMTNLS